MPEQRLRLELLRKLDWYRGLGYDVHPVSDETSDEELECINAVLQEKHRVDKLAHLRDGLIALFGLAIYTVSNPGQDPDIYTSSDN